MKKEIITTLQRGKDYSLWYYFRYYPSINRLKEKLNEKTNKNQDLINKILNEVWHLFNDINVLESKVQNFLFRNKNKKYIITNLLQKKFIKSDIEKILNQFTTQWESLLSENFIEKKIYQFIQKNKSKQYIRNKLIEQPEDKELVESILNNIFNEDNEISSIKKELEKLNNKNLDHQKIIQRLLSKWFRYDDIKKAL